MPRLALSSVARSRFLGLAGALLGAAGISGVFLDPAGSRKRRRGIDGPAVWRTEMRCRPAAWARLGCAGGLTAPRPLVDAIAFALMAGATPCAVTARASLDPTQRRAAAWIALASRRLPPVLVPASLDASFGPTFHLFHGSSCNTGGQAVAAWLLSSRMMTAASAAVFAVASACREESSCQRGSARWCPQAPSAAWRYRLSKSLSASSVPGVAPGILRIARVSPSSDVNAVSALFLLPPAAVGIIAAARRAGLGWLLFPGCSRGSGWPDPHGNSALPIAFTVQAWPWLKHRAPRAADCRPGSPCWPRPERSLLFL